MELDRREEQLELEYKDELASTNLKYAFSGFGRSSDTLRDILEVGQRNRERQANLRALLSTENELRRLRATPGVDEGRIARASKDLSDYKKGFVQLSTQSEQRRTKKVQEVQSVGAMMERLFNLRMRASVNKRSPKSFKLRLSPLQPYKFKSVKLKEVGSTGSSVGKLSNINKFSDLGSFGS